jgi:hypothetical protein
VHGTFGCAARASEEEMGEHYILDGRDIKPVDLMTWARWLETNRSDKIIKQEDVGPFWVSTVFLGLDHRFGDDGPPVLFETMVFGRNADGSVNYSEVHSERCCTYEEAEEMHQRACEWSARSAGVEPDGEAPSTP